MVFPYVISVIISSDIPQKFYYRGVPQVTLGDTCETTWGQWLILSYFVNNTPYLRARIGFTVDIHEIFMLTGNMEGNTLRSRFLVWGMAYTLFQCSHYHPIYQLLLVKLKSYFVTVQPASRCYVLQGIAILHWTNIGMNGSLFSSHALSCQTPGRSPHNGFVWPWVKITELKRWNSEVFVKPDQAVLTAQ